MPVFRERLQYSCILPSHHHYLPHVLPRHLQPIPGGLATFRRSCCTSFPRCSSLYSSSCLNHLLEHLNKPTYTPLPSLFFLSKENSAFCYKNKTQSQRQFCPLGPQWRMFFYLCGTLISLGGRSVPEAALYRCWNGQSRFFSPLNTAISD